MSQPPNSKSSPFLSVAPSFKKYVNPQVRIKKIVNESSVNSHLNPFKRNLKVRKKIDFLVYFYAWISTVTRIKSHYEETVYFLLLNLQELLVLI